MASTAPGLSSPAYQRALEQAREIRRRKTRESAQAAERLWFEYIREMLTTAADGTRYKRAK